MAIEPIKGFYVHDEATDTDGVAKYDASALANLDDTVNLQGYAPDAKAVGNRLSAIEETANHADELATTLNEGGLELKDSIIEGQVDTWLDDHPEATTTVQDGAITKAKINTAFLPEIENEYVTPEQFGAVGDGTTDDTTAVNNAIEEAISSKKVLYFSPKTYLCPTGIVIETPPNIIMDGYIKTTSGTGLTIGKTGTFFTNKFMKLCTSRSESGNTGTTGIKIINPVNSKIELFDSSGYDVGVELIGDNGPAAYNTFILVNIRSLSTSLKFSAIGTGYTNENLFLGGRFVETATTGSRAIILHGNNNVFVKPCMERAEVAIKCQAGRNNKVISARTESSTYAAEFDAQSWANDFEIGYGTYAVKDGVVNYNAVRYNTFSDVSSAGGEFASTYNNTVFDSGNLNGLITLGNPNTMQAPLYFVTTGGAIKRNPEQVYLSRNENKPNEIVLGGSSFGVFVDCSITKTFLINQGGAGPGKIVYKIYDIDKQPIDMSTLTPISPEEYTSYYGTGGAFFASRYPTSTITVPDSAKYVYIGISKYTGNSFYSFNIKSKELATIIKDWT